MKALLQTLLAACFATSAFAQGTVTFNNRITGTLYAPVYGSQLDLVTHDFLNLWGNASEGIPPGTQVYAGARLEGSGFTAQLWGAPGANQPETALQLLGGYSTATFRTGAATGNVPGAIAPSTQFAIVPGAPAGSIATLQVRAWNNKDG